MQQQRSVKHRLSAQLERKSHHDYRSKLLVLIYLEHMHWKLIYSSVQEETPEGYFCLFEDILDIVELNTELLLADSLDQWHQF